MINLFKFIAISEGITYIALLLNMFVTKPYYIEAYKTILFPLGMLHGILFIAYIILSFIIKKNQQWSFLQLALVLIASFIPFGTFYIEKKYVKKNI